MALRPRRDRRQPVPLHRVRPILAAASRGRSRTRSATRRERGLLFAPGALPGGSFQAPSFIAPASVAELAAFLLEHPQATILAGGTDVGLWITKQHRDLDPVAYVGRVTELRFLKEEKDCVEIGDPSVTHEDAYAALAGIHPDIGELVRRLGAAQVRATGTLAGNIANGSPIGDTMPVLLALGASVALQRRAAAKDRRAG